MYARDAGKTIPLVAATFMPACQPILAVFFFRVWAGILAASADASLVTPVECPGVHIALLSSHMVFLRLRRLRSCGPGYPIPFAGCHWRWFDVTCIGLTQRSNTTGSTVRHISHESKARKRWPLLFGSESGYSYNHNWRNAYKRGPDSSISADEIAQYSIGVTIIAALAPDQCYVPVAATFDRESGDAGALKQC